jgi:hypothetical protein
MRRLLLAAVLILTSLGTISALTGISPVAPAYADQTGDGGSSGN